MLLVKFAFRLNFLTQVDSQFPLSPSLNYSRIRVRKQLMEIENQPRLNQNEPEIKFDLKHVL